MSADWQEDHHWGEGQAWDGIISSSGSGATDWNWNDHTQEVDEDRSYDDAWVVEHEGDYDHAQVFASGDLPPGALMSAKIPPAFDGTTSWFQYEEMLLDWIDSTTLEEKLRGPAVKNRLYGLAASYKYLLDREKLKSEEGVTYLVRLLRPKFVKGAETVFLWRLRQYMRLDRGHSEFIRWLTTFDKMKKRLLEAWSDCLEMPPDASTEYNVVHAQAVRDEQIARNQELTDAEKASEPFKAKVRKLI